MRRYPAAVLLALSLLVFFRHSLLEGRVLFPVGFLSERLPGGIERAPGDVPLAREEGFWDIVGNVFPWQLHLRSELREGRISWWLPDAGGGQPFLANDSPGALWPGNWIAALFFPAPWQLTVMAFLRFATASSGMIVLLRRFGLTAPAQATGAVAFTFCWMMQYGIAWPHANAAAMLPWIFFALEGVFSAPGGRSAALLAFAVGISLFAGHSQTTAQGLFVAGIYSLARTFRPEALADKSRAAAALVWAFGGVALGFAIGALQILPVLELAPRSYAWEARGLPFHMPRQLALMSLAPNAFGALWWRDAAGKLAISGPSFHDWPSMCGYVGLSTLAFVPAAFRRPRPVWVFPLVLVAVLCACIAYGLGTQWLYFRLPVIAKTPVFRFFIPMSFALACLAAAGVDAVLADGRWRKHVIVAGALLVLASAVTVFAVEGPFTPLARGWKPITATLVLIAALAALPRASWLKWAFPAICVAELLLVLNGANPWARARDVYPKKGPALAAFRTPSEGAFAASGGILTPEITTAYEIRDLRGRPPLTAMRWRRFFDRLDKDVRNSENLLYMVSPDPDWYRIAGIDRFLMAAMPSEPLGWIKSGIEPKGAYEMLKGSVIDQTISCETGNAQQLLVFPGRNSSMQVRNEGEFIPIAETVRGGPDRAYVRFKKAVRCPATLELVVTGGDQAAEVPSWPLTDGASAAVVDGRASERVIGAVLFAHPLPGDAIWLRGLVMLKDANARPLAWPTESVHSAADAASAEAILVEKAADSSRWAVIEGAFSTESVKLAAGEIIRARFVSPQRIEAEATLDHDRWVVFHQSWDPGWKLRIDDGPPISMLPANLVYQGARVPAGTHRLALEYNPPRFAAGLIATIAGLLLAVLLIGPRALLQFLRAAGSPEDAHR